MRNYPFRLLNVFAESTFGGNPLCVFEHAEGLSDEEMQALALQFNLSETTFILPSATATARMRIFTPGTEMPFAGHPSLGTAHVVRTVLGSTNALTLECKAGIV
ncbi:MAG: PhzF family phenazine biosynthesis protein, partial [Burkholderiales bacterium]|nr:PhzF family phenazine biosynthesis protein [Burkholderiales bacterium]